MTKKPKSAADIQVRRGSVQPNKSSDKSRPEMIMRMVQLDCALIPVLPYDKKPGIKDWPNKWSKNQKQLKAYFLTNASCIYGIVTGAASGIFVVDLDRLEGVENFQRLEKKYGRCLPTLTVRTPNGLHLFFRSPRHPVGNSTSKIAESIDIRGDRGYVVGPGSETTLAAVSGSRTTYEGPPTSIAVGSYK